MLNRRDFLRLIGLGGVGAGAGFALSESTKKKAAGLIPYVVPPEEVIPGVANWYASLCTQCSAGCGVIVKVMEGRAKKIEGNPSHPVNKGKLCARGQAALQALYNPDRVEGPLKRTGERGSGKFEKISWDEGLAILAKKLKEQQQAGDADGLYVLTSSQRGHLNKLIDTFCKSYGTKNHIHHELLQQRNLTFANQIAFGIDEIPHYDIENANLILSFGADFLGTWVSPVSYAKGYGHMRQGRSTVRGKLIQLEPRMSQTGANADQWIPVKPGSEGLLAMGMAAAILEGGYYKRSDRDEWSGLLNGYDIKDIAHKCDVSEERIREVARLFATTRQSLALGGEGAASCEGGVSNIVAINILNHLGGTIGRKGGILPNPSVPLQGKPSFKGIGDVAMAASTSRLKTLILHNSNPLFAAPLGMKLEEAFRKIPFIASFSTFMDESTEMADLILPSNTSLEDWGDDFTEPSVRYGVSTIMQPVVSPFYDTKSAGDIFISLARGVGGSTAKALTWSDFQTFLKGEWKRRYRNYGGRKEATFEVFWSKVLADGGWWPSQKPVSKSISISSRRIRGQVPTRAARYDGDEKGFPFYLTLYPHTAYYDGRGANLPWLQEMPDPMTSVVWGTWVEMNPKTAKGMGIKEGDVVTVESPHGTISAPVYHYPAIRPDTIAVPIGQGHSSYGKYAMVRGANPIDLLPHKLDKRTGALPLNATRVKITKGGSGGKLVKMEGSTDELDRGIVKTVPPEKI